MNEVSPWQGVHGIIHNTKQQLIKVQRTNIILENVNSRQYFPWDWPC